MSFLLFVLVFISVSMGASAQILLKQGMSKPAVQESLNSGSATELVLEVVGNIEVIGGIALYAGSMVVWLAVLSKIDVTQAYPFVGLGFLITMAFGYFYLGEAVTLTRVLGTVLVASGVVLVANS